MAKVVLRSLLLLLAVGAVWFGEAQAQTVEQRVADEVKATELKRAAEERIIDERAAKLAQVDETERLRAARLLYVSSDTSFFETPQLHNALRDDKDFKILNLNIVDGWQGHQAADLHIEIDRPLFTYTYTYTVTDRRTSVLLGSGKVTAFDSNAAAPKLARAIIRLLQPADANASRNSGKGSK